jgi:anthranilate synthase component 1
MDINSFREYAKSYDIVPVFEKITADLLTPVLAYLKIRKPGKQSFLLESVEGGEKIARYSFIGCEPGKIFHNNGRTLTIETQAGVGQKEESIFDYIRSEFGGLSQPSVEGLPSFTGGLVGFLGYENIALIEDVINFDEKSASPDSIFGYYDTILAFDHFRHQIILISNVRTGTGINSDDAYFSAKMKLKNLREDLRRNIETLSSFASSKNIAESISDDLFKHIVEESKNNILEGDIFQIVLSKRFSAKYSGDLINVYRALRIINPSPYMYFLEFKKDFTVIGTSPEDLVRVHERVVNTLPIAGTRRRGITPEDDKRLEEELMNDPKEIAEHVMLLDLGRNDLGRVCKYGSVHVKDKMEIQKYSHVMHIVSKVEGKLSDGKDQIDALKSCFPAGTVSGAPKIRAIQLINEYEKSIRNVYAGAVGYMDLSGNLDMCIAIRTFFADGNTISWQAGAGIVADSNPDLELKEIRNKSAVLVNALKYAEVLDENSGN